MTTWKKLKNDLSISPEDINAIELEKDLIRTMVSIREEKGLTQSQLAEMCNVKQPVIARMESSVHSPQIDSLLKILTPLGYTLQIVPIAKKTVAENRNKNLSQKFLFRLFHLFTVPPFLHSIPP